ncbi:MAG: sulfatase-like hydrolase/transferase, partial [Thermoanaerobaculia bacterium]|nr:sulfatase-like hydrolase/transferase [Thermoanaerobaculia bacterium]
LGDLEGTSIGNYLHGMHFLDSAMGNFVGMLQDEELLNETVIAFWGDHGAGLPWDYAMGDLLGIRPTEPMFYRVSEVPVLISIGGGSSAFGERDMPCGQVDLAPTLLGLLGIDASPYPFVGRNLFGNPGEGPVMGQYTVWFDDEHLYLDKGPELEAGRCYRTDSLQIVPVERCREGEMRAKETMQISRDVILHDLHVPIARHLSRSDRPPDE